MSETDPIPDPMCYEVVLKGLCNTKALDEASDLIAQMQKHGIGFTPSLREVLTASFGEAGCHEELDGLLNTNRLGYVPRHPLQRGRLQPSKPSAGPQFFKAQPNPLPQMNNGVPPGHMNVVLLPTMEDKDREYLPRWLGHGCIPRHPVRYMCHKSVIHATSRPMLSDSMCLIRGMLLLLIIMEDRGHPKHFRLSDHNISLK